MAQQVKDAPVIVSGLVIDNEVRSERDTGKVKDRKVLVLAQLDGGTGQYNVVVPYDEMRYFDPTPMVDHVTIWVRSGAYAVDGNSGMSTKFIREVTAADLDAMAARISGAKQTSAEK